MDRICRISSLSLDVATRGGSPANATHIFDLLWAYFKRKFIATHLPRLSRKVTRILGRSFFALTEPFMGPALTGGR